MKMSFTREDGSPASHNSTLAGWRQVSGVPVVLALSLALAGCGLGGRALTSAPPTPGPQLPIQARAPLPTPAPGPARPQAIPETKAGALNARLLTQVSPPTADADLPIGPGDLIEVSVFEVEELSKLKVRT